MTQGAIISGILADLQQKRYDRERLCDKAFRDFLAAHPAVEEAHRAMVRARRAQARRLGTAEEAAQARAAYHAAVAAAGGDLTRFEPAVDCPYCRDSGYEGEETRRLCRCVLQRAAEQAGSATGIRPDYTFQRFDRERFAETPLDDQRTVRDYMVQVAQFMYRQSRTGFPDARVVLLMGPTGTGKTYLLHATANSLMEAGHTVLMTTPYLLNQVVMRSDYGSDGLDAYIGTEVLCIDDLGSEPLYRKVTAEALFTVLDRRMMAGKLTLISSNVNLKEMQERYGERLVSRLRDTKQARIIPVEGPDLRVNAQK